MSIAPISSSSAAAQTVAMAPTVTPSAPAASAGSDRPTPSPQLEPNKPLGEEQANQVVAKLNLRVEMVHSSVRFHVDDSSGKTVITVMNTDSGEVIRQIPSEEAIRLAEALKKDEGTIINTKA